MKLENLDSFDPENTTVLMFYSDQCHFCQTTKPKFEELSEKYKDITFNMVELNDENQSLYNKYIQEVPMRVQAREEDGTLVYFEDGSPMMTYLADDNGVLMKHKPIVIPNFFVFDKKLSEDDKGFLGNIEGNLEQLEHVITGVIEANNG